jgi:predicted AlkP superfamily pyrophosphatase or phosphodiesterase
MRNQFSLLLFLVLVIAISSCDNARQQTHPNKILLISFDGFRYDYLNKVHTPNFDTLTTNGVAAEGLIPIFPSKTFPNHYSIATGLYPENSGFVGNIMYDPKWEEWYRIGDRQAVENGKWYGGEPIWNTLEKQDVKTGTMFWVGSEADIQGMRPTYWKQYDGDMPFKARVDTVLKWLSAPDSQAVDFATLYFEHVDGAGHRYGTDSDSLNSAIRESDRIIGYLKKQMRQQDFWKQTNILVVSDHGMVNLSADKLIRLDNIIDIDDTERVIWGPLTMIQPKEGTSENMYKALKNNQDHYQVYKKEDIPERYHLKNNRRVTDLVVVADRGYTVLNSKYEEQFVESLPRATHGYDPSDKKMESFFIAHGPAFKSGTTVESFQSIHLYELINQLMGTTPAPNDGSLDSVKVLLK